MRRRKASTVALISATCCARSANDSSDRGAPGTLKYARHFRSAAVKAGRGTGSGEMPATNSSRRASASTVIGSSFLRSRTMSSPLIS
jgi:hypothetical protein